MSSIQMSQALPFESKVHLRWRGWATVVSVPAGMVSRGLWVTAGLSALPLCFAASQKELFQQAAGSGMWANGKLGCGYL